MPFVTSDDIRAEQVVLAEKAKRLQAALDHLHEIDAALDDDEHPLHRNVADLRASLTAARDATAERARFNEGLLVRVLKEEAVGIR